MRDAPQTRRLCQPPTCRLPPIAFRLHKMPTRRLHLPPMRHLPPAIAALGFASLLTDLGVVGGCLDGGGELPPIANMWALCLGRLGWWGELQYVGFGALVGLAGGELARPMRGNRGPTLQSSSSNLTKACSHGAP